MIMKIQKLLILLTFSFISNAWSETRFSETLCNKPEYSCLTIKPGESWNNLLQKRNLPENPELIDIIKRANRMNTKLKPGMTLALPNNLERITIYDVSPFPRYIESDSEKSILISQKELAWAAYDETGELIWWGPISSGSLNCQAYGGCKTPTGSFNIIRKQDIDCISTAFPKRADGYNGGAVMPFCMHFFRGYALHGSDDVPGYRASHGCVRMFIEDARWLNEEFIELPGAGRKGTRVIIDE
jgi:hypothetical protein